MNVKFKLFINNIVSYNWSIIGSFKYAYNFSVK